VAAFELQEVTAPPEPDLGDFEGRQALLDQHTHAPAPAGRWARLG
jgi:hypothetical protein